MKNFCYHVVGTGKINIIVLSGWGVNSKIWFFIVQKLKFFFKFYLVDLPGSGKNRNLDPMKIHEIIKILYYHMPKKSIWLGWSIGGLIASYFALFHPKHTLGVISVASSPCFIKKENWPGIKKNTAYSFYIDLKTRYYKTISNFLNLQKIDSKQCVQDINILNNILLAETQPSLKLLENSLEMILLIDLRLDVTFIKVPMLRIYGALDNLVPKKIVSILDKKWPKTNSIIIEKASHAPFISHKNKFCSILLNFKNFF